MAFNKAPSQSTYQTKDISLINTLRGRDTSSNYDSLSLNGFFDIIKDKTTEEKESLFVKRDGTVRFPYSVTGGTTVRGMFFWEEQSKVLIAFGTSIAICNSTTGALITTVTPFITTTGDVGFTEFYYDDGTTKIVVSDGSRLITIDSANTVVTGSDVDMPTNFSPFTVFLDGFLFLIRDGTSDIYNSNLNDPLAFTAGDFITAEMVADKLLRIVRLNNYIVAFGTSSMEYFYNAANASGSPLNRVDIPLKNIGYIGGLASKANKLYFVGQAAETSPEVFVIEDWKIESLETPPIRRFLSTTGTVYGAVVTNGGFDFYVVTIGAVTYAMNLENKSWTRWAFQAGTTFPAASAIQIYNPTYGFVSLMAFPTGTDLYYLAPGVYRDDGVNFLVSTITEKLTFDTFHRKFGGRLAIIADKANVSTATLSWTDNDYQTYSSTRTIDLSQERPCVYRMGNFRERAFKLDYSQNTPLRINRFEFDFNIGST